MEVSVCYAICLSTWTHDVLLLATGPCLGRMSSQDSSYFIADGLAFPLCPLLSDLPLLSPGKLLP